MPKHRKTRSFIMKSHFLGRRFHIIPSREPAVFGSHREVLYHMRRRVSRGKVYAQKLWYFHGAGGGSSVQKTGRNPAPVQAQGFL